MRWPFRLKRQKMVRLPAVELTEEESQECESMLRSLTRADGGEYLIREEVADSFTRSIVALCLMGSSRTLCAASSVAAKICRRGL